MNVRTFLLILAGGAVASTAFGQAPSVTVKGEIVREDGTPVAAATVTAVERAPWSIIGPMPDRKVARTVSDAAGRFAIQLPAGTRMRRLMLVASGEWKRMKEKNGEGVGLFGTSVPLRKVTQDGNNRIIVPNSFRPARREKGHISENG